MPQKAECTLDIAPRRIVCVAAKALPWLASAHSLRTHALLKELDGAGMEVFCLRRSVGQKSDWHRTLDNVQYYALKGPHYGKSPLDEYIAESASILEEKLRQLAPALVHAVSTYEAGLPALIAARRLGLPFIYEVRSFREYDYAALIPGYTVSERFQLEKALESLILQNADHVFALNAALRDECLARGTAADRISLLPEAVDVRDIGIREYDETLASQLGIQRSDYVIGYIGSVVPYEGLDDLIAALTAIQKTVPQARILIIGTGSALEDLKVQAAPYGDSVIFTGSVPCTEFAAYRSLMNVCVLPRKPLEYCQDIFQLVPSPNVYDVMAYGKPLIASNVRVFADMVQNYSTGFLTQPGDAKDIARLVSLLVTNPDMSAAITRNALRSSQDHTWESNIALLAGVYKTFLAPGAPIFPEKNNEYFPNTGMVDHGHHVTKRDKLVQHLNTPLPLKAENISVISKDKKNDILAQFSGKVTGLTAYEFSFTWEGEAAFSEKCAIVVPKFYNKDGQNVECYYAAKMMSGESYSYLAETSGEKSGKCLFFVPHNAESVKVQFRRWTSTLDFGKISATISTAFNDYILEGKINLPEGKNFFISSEIVANSFVFARDKLELFFFTESGQNIPYTCLNFESNKGRPNFITLSMPTADRIIHLHRAFDAPDFASTVVWRLCSEHPNIMEFEKWFSVEKVLGIRESLSSFLPEHTAVEDFLSPVDIVDVYHPDKVLSDSIMDGTYSFVGLAQAQTTSNEWLQIFGSFNIRPVLEKSVFVIKPLYYDSEKHLINSAQLPGCSNIQKLGLARKLMPHSSTCCDSLTFAEYFLSPPMAVYAVFYVISLDSIYEFHPKKISVKHITPEDIFINDENIDAAITDAEILTQRFQLAKGSYSITATAKYSGLLSFADPKNSKVKSNYHLYTDILKVLNVNWLPYLAKQKEYVRDEKSILHLFKVIAPDESSGGAVRGTAIVEAQAARGLTPCVCMPLNIGDISSDAKEGLFATIRSGVRIYYGNLPNISRKQILPSELLQMETSLANSVLAENKISLIHAASGFKGYENALKGLALAKGNDLPLVYEVRSFHEHTWRPLDKTWLSDELTQLRIKQENRCMKEADAVVTISLAMVDKLLERGVESQKLFFVPNAIDPVFEQLPESGEIIQLRRSLGLEGKKTIGYISNFSKREGHVILFEAFAKLAEQYSDLCLVLPGDGAERTSILEKSKEAGLFSRVILPGIVPHAEIRSWYHLIDLFVVPRIADFASDYVTPLKPFEAMSQKRPVFISDRPVSREISGDTGERAMIFPSGDADALASVISESLSKPEELKKKAMCAYEWVKKERVWSSVVERYDAVYEKAREIHAASRQKRGGF